VLRIPNLPLPGRVLSEGVKLLRTLEKIVASLIHMWTAIATRYESHWWIDFPHPSRPALGPSQPRLELIPSLFRGGNVVGAWL
jgi:hypothetical protein